MTRRLAWITLVAASTILLHGCGPIASFFPLYKSDDRVLEPGLVGIWKLADPDPNNPDDINGRWTFKKSDDGCSYDLRLGTVGASGALLVRVHLVRIGSGLFADFEGDTGNKALESKDALIAFPVMETHLIGGVRLEKGNLEIRLLKEDWVKERIKAGAFSLSHLGENGDLILTASTDELRKFMQEHAEDEEALSENFKLVRDK